MIFLIVASTTWHLDHLTISLSCTGDCWNRTASKVPQQLKSSIPGCSITDLPNTTTGYRPRHLHYWTCSWLTKRIKLQFLLHHLSSEPIYLVPGPDLLFIFSMPRSSLADFSFDVNYVCDGTCMFHYYGTAREIGRSVDRIVLLKNLDTVGNLGIASYRFGLSNSTLPTWQGSTYFRRLRTS